MTLQAAAAAAADADAAIVVVGYTAADEGEYVGSFDPELAVLYPPAEDPNALTDLARVWDEGPQFVGGDRDSLRLHPEDEALIRAVAAANPRTVVVVVAGATVVMEEWRHDVPAIVIAWYAGMEGGAALADILLGIERARRAAAVHRPPRRGRPAAVRQERHHGRRTTDGTASGCSNRDGKQAAYPLGFGLATRPSPSMTCRWPWTPTESCSRSAPPWRTPEPGPEDTWCRSTPRGPEPGTGSSSGSRAPSGNPARAGPGGDRGAARPPGNVAGSRPLEGHRWRLPHRRRSQLRRPGINEICVPDRCVMSPLIRHAISRQPCGSGRTAAAVPASRAGPG